MADPDGTLGGAENETKKINLDDNNSTRVELDLDESKAQLINANGGAGRGDHPDEYKIVEPTPASSDGEVSFNGLGKEEVMRYAQDPFWVRLRWILFILFWVGWLAMLVTAVAIIVLAPRCPPRPDLKWYQQETIYQVFPKSFKDSDGDGIGDYEGLKGKMEDYINEKLDIKAVWINNIYKTADGSSYGILDHKAIDDSFGVTVDQFKSWLKKQRKAGKRVILDLIPNQTSRNHTWFQRSQAGEAPYTDYYIWSDTPNNWETVDGKAGWTLDTKRGAHYYSQHGEAYPDLNLNNTDVRNEIKDIMKFWLDAGVSGFHIDDLEYLVEDPLLTPYDAEKSQTKNYVGTLDLLEELRAIASDYSDKPGRERLIFGTLNDDANLNQSLSNYFGPKESKRLHIVTPLLKNFDKQCDAECVRDMFESRVNDEGHQWLGLQFGNANVERIASRMGSMTEDYQSRLLIAYTLQMLLPGTPFNYYGDEFGQRGSTGLTPAENNYRTPMQWTSEENAGFTDPGVTPHIPVGDNYKKDNVQVARAQLSDQTPLTAFVDLAHLRGNESFQWGKTEICAPTKDLLFFTRKATRFPYFLVIMNFGNQELHVSPQDLECVSTKEYGTVKFHTSEDVDTELNFKSYATTLKPHDIMVVQFSADD